jgi:dihydrofolate reductase
MKCFLIAAQTVDGFIAERNDQVSTAWTSGADKKWFSQRTKSAGVIVMGATTFRTINRALPGRLTVIYTRNPDEFKNFEPAEVMTTQASPADLLQQLADRGFSEVAICGGASIYSLFLKAGLIDTLFLTIEPVLFGQGVGLFEEKTLTKLQLKNTTHLSDDTLLLE